MDHLVNILLTQQCDRRCSYCVMAPWLNRKDELDGGRLVKWLKEWFRPDEAFIKITGGEPSLRPDLDRICTALAFSGFSGVIETNGSKPIKKNPNFFRLATWHWPGAMPTAFDGLQIIEEQGGFWHQKAVLEKTKCRWRAIPMRNTEKSRTQCYDRLNRDGSKKPPARFKKMTSVYSSSDIAPCPGRDPFGLKVGDAPCIRKIEDDCRWCPQCTNIEEIAALGWISPF